MISFKNLRKKYQNNAELIYKDYVINSEDFIAITGPSGSGKSTLLDLISNLSSPTSGTIEILGKEMSFYEENEKERTNLRKHWDYEPKLPTSIKSHHKRKYFTSMHY